MSAAAGAGLISVTAGARGTAAEIEPVVTEFEFIAGKPTRNVFSFLPGAPAPTLRVQQGERLNVRLKNRLKEPTTLHWHGIRLPHAMDGVPFLSQPYVYENETFDYSFAPPDAGTYWYHPHCNSLHQLGWGLTGLLIVDEKTNPGFDADIGLNLRDWRLGDDGQFQKLYNPRQSARAGTFGTIRTTNWVRSPEYTAPAGGLARVRFCATDVTRIYKLGLEAGAKGLIIALDGNPLATPLPLETVAVGPGQRLDVVVRLPDNEGETIPLVDYSVQEPLVVARLKAVGRSLKRHLGEVKALPPNPIPEPDLKSATTIPFEFQATAENIPKSKICGDLGFSFWAINAKPWPGTSPDPIAPLAELKLGRSYVLSLFNRTPHAHPIHLHGLSFKLLRSDRRAVPQIWTDTALIMPDERMDVALVADNPGDWLLHCHVIEHQEAGMTGIIRVA